MAALVDPQTREPLDRALTLWFPGPTTATGEDLVELHLHGGRAVVEALLTALGWLPGMRPADAGEFTRRAFENGRIDLTEAEGMGALLSAETELQRRAAMALVGGALRHRVERWEEQLVAIAARVEAALDFSDEDDVSSRDGATDGKIETLIASIDDTLAAPPAERLRDGVRVVIAGQPNAGKSSLINALIERDAAIVSPLAGTTRDVIEAPVIIDGVPIILIDTAGLRGETGDAIEAVGIERARAQIAAADIIVALDDSIAIDERTMVVTAKADLAHDVPAGLSVSIVTGQGLPELRAAIVARARALLPSTDAVAINARQRSAIRDARAAFAAAQESNDELVRADELRRARTALGRVTGRGDVESLLDTVFGAFCIGK